MKKAFTLIELIASLAIIAILVTIVVGIFRSASCSTISSIPDDFEGCVNPKIIGTTPTVNPITGYSDVEYIYECEDGRQIASTKRPQNLMR